MDVKFDSLSAGAKFVRADLHIHSYGDEGSYDVTDTTMTPEAIVDTAIEKGLSIIAITDHNEIGNVKKAVKHAEGKNILVVPGIEISTTQGHLLLYFDIFENLKSFFGKLTVASNKETCTQGIIECLTFAEQFNGFGVLAHIELTSGFELTVGRFGPQFEDIVCHPNLWGLEISNKSSSDNYTPRDSSDDRKRMTKARLSKLSLHEEWEFPVMMSSDSHTLAKLGLNAEGNKKLTRLKMDSLSFQGFKIALQNSSSRVRLEDLIPEKTPCFVGIHIEGGLLDKQTIDLNKNLTCIIGGRGAGKSTLLECIKETSGNGSGARIVDSDVWPEKIFLVYEDETGQAVTLTREKNGQIVNADDPSEGITKVPIETYGQGETENTVKDCDTDPSNLIDFLDSFIDFGILKYEEQSLREQIIDNQSEVNKLRIEVSAIEETERQKKHYEGKLDQLKKGDVEELVKYQQALITEREIRKNIISDLKALIETYKGILADNSVFEAFEALEEDEIEVGKENIKKVKELVSDFGKIVSDKSSELNTELDEKLKELRPQIADWNSKESEIQKAIDEKKAELEKQGIPFDMGQINRIISDLSYYQEKLKELKAKEAALNLLLFDRTLMIKGRIEKITKIYNKRVEFALQVKSNLQSSVDGFFVDLKYLDGKYSPEFESDIKRVMGWKTSNVPKSTLLAKFISPMDFAQCIRKKNFDLLKGLVDNGLRVFSDTDLMDFVEKLCKNKCYEDFEGMAYGDWPVLSVTKMIEQADGSKKPHTRNIAKLSLGQQQSVILGILLHSRSKAPLLIDQPEDNLDSEFIYKTIVNILRKIKETRQVIIVTHNANIAVLGDAELIIPLKSTSVASHVINSGSIDRLETRDLCCEILEGGVSAFKKRKEIYGI